MRRLIPANPLCSVCSETDCDSQLAVCFACTQIDGDLCSVCTEIGGDMCSVCTEIGGDLCSVCT